MEETILFENNEYKVLVDNFPYPDYNEYIRGYAVINLKTGVREMECRTLPGAIGYATQLEVASRQLKEEARQPEEAQEGRLVN